MVLLTAGTGQLAAGWAAFADNGAKAKYMATETKSVRTTDRMVVRILDIFYSPFCRNARLNVEPILRLPQPPVVSENTTNGKRTPPTNFEGRTPLSPGKKKEPSLLARLSAERLLLAYLFCPFHAR